MSNKGYKYASLCAQLQFKALHNGWEFAEPQVIVPMRQEIPQHNTSLEDLRHQNEKNMSLGNTTTLHFRSRTSTVRLRNWLALVNWWVHC